MTIEQLAYLPIVKMKTYHDLRVTITMSERSILLALGRGATFKELTYQLGRTDRGVRQAAHLLYAKLSADEGRLRQFGERMLGCMAS